MRLTLWPSAQQPWSDLRAEVQHAERTGWDGVYVADHFMGDDGRVAPVDTPTLESTAVVSAIGSLTSRMRVGTLVLGNTYRHPTVVAKWASTLDHVTDGRAVLGLGAGWQANEHQQYGIDLPGRRERVDRLDEACRVVTSLLRNDRSDFRGRYYELSDAVCEPKPVQDRLPVLIGASGDRMLGVVARHADEWNTWGLPARIAERGRQLERSCERLDRDPAEIARSAQALVMITEDRSAADSFLERVAPQPAIAGPVELFAETVSAWAAVGVEEVVVPDFALGRGDGRLERLDAIRAAVASEA